MIEAEVKIEEPVSRITYPWIGIYNKNPDHVVLFNKRNAGTVLRYSPNVGVSVGSYQTNWSESEYIPLFGSITLTQKG